MIILDNYKIQIGKLTLLTESSAAFKKNEVHILWGANGSGKSTFLLDLLESNITKVHGLDIQESFSFVPQSIEDQHFIGTTKDFIQLWGHPSLNDYGLEIDLPRLLTTPFNKLSGGEKQLITILCALNDKTNLCILDEPTSALDPKFTGYIQKLIKIKSQEKSFLIVTHDKYFSQAVGSKFWGILNLQLLQNKSYEECFYNKIYGLEDE